MMIQLNVKYVKIYEKLTLCIPNLSLYLYNIKIMPISRSQRSKNEKSKQRRLSQLKLQKKKDTKNKTKDTKKSSSTKDTKKSSSTKDTKKSSSTKDTKKSSSTRRKVSSLRKKNASKRIQRAFRKTERCGICLDRVQKNIGNHCHDFHPRCIQNWISRGHLTCPTCKQFMPELGIHVQSQLHINTDFIIRIKNEVDEIYNDINDIVNDINELDETALDDELPNSNETYQVVLTRINEMHYIIYNTIDVHFTNSDGEYTDENINRQLRSNYEWFIRRSRNFLYELRQQLEIVEENAQIRGTT